MTHLPNQAASDLATAHKWASDLMNEEDQDRTLVLEGLLEMITDVIVGTPVDFSEYARMYTYY